MTASKKAYTDIIVLMIARALLKIPRPGMLPGETAHNFMEHNANLNAHFYLNNLCSE